MEVYAARTRLLAAGWVAAWLGGSRAPARGRPAGRRVDCCASCRRDERAQGPPLRVVQDAELAVAASRLPQQAEGA